MCQGACSVGLSLDHRDVRTGAPDDQRSVTCRRFAEIWEEVRAGGGEGGEEGVVAGGEEGEGGEGKGENKGLSVEEAAKKLGDEFHSPGHVFLCVESEGGLRRRRGHTELSVALAKLAGITPIMVGCVMLSNDGDDFGALPPNRVRDWALKNNIPFLTGKEIIDEILKEGSSPLANRTAA